MVKYHALSTVLLGLSLGPLVGCGDAHVASGTEPVGRPAPVREVELSEPAPVTTPSAETAPAETQRAAVAPAEPTFAGLAETPGGAAPRIADVAITLERTGCLGTCPIYTVDVGGDGTVRYAGKNYVVRTEPAESKIDPARLEPILRELEALDYLRHEHRCRSAMRDSPGTAVKLVVGKTSRRFFENRTGRECGQDATPLDLEWHANVDRIGRLLDELVQSDRWIGTEQQRHTAFMRDR